MNDLARYKLLAKAKVPPAAKLLYSYLMDRAGGRLGCVLLSGKKLALEVGLSPSTVRRNLHRLHTYRTPSDYGSLFRRRHSSDQSNYASVREVLS